MKNAVTASHVNVRGNLDTSQAQRMTIDADGMVIVMGLLSNLYSNGNEAVVREYACNARDSHVESGQTRPIEITLPSPLNPQFLVQDWGLGLTRDEIFNVYAKYGSSTKRNSNEQIGAFGIGAKSAFTVGNQFTVTGVKDGEKTIVMFAKRNDGTPTVQELFHGATDEPNGVTVDVGVENVQAVVASADKIFQCWKPGTVLVDGEVPATMWDNAEKLADEVYVDWASGANKYDSASHFKLVMGGVPYNIPTVLWNELSPKAQAFYNGARSTSITYVLDVPIGRVDITPNREELHITPRTRSTVGRLIELAANSRQAWITAKLDKADNIWEAAGVYRDLVAKLNYQADPKNVYWKGQALGDDNVKLDADTYSLSRKNWQEDKPSSYRTAHTDGWYARIGLRPSGYKDFLFVTGVPDGKVNFVRTYSKLTLLDAGKEHIIAIRDNGYRNGWFSVGEGADHEDIDYVDFKTFWENGKKLRKAQGGSARSKTKYATWSTGDTRSHLRNVEDIADLDTARVIFSYSLRMNMNDPVHHEFLKNHDITVVHLKSQQSTTVFQRAFPSAVQSGSLVRDWAAAQIAHISNDDRRILKANSLNDQVNDTAVDFITKHRGKIHNKAVIKYLDEFKSNSTLTQAEKDRLSYLENLYQNARIANPHQAGETEDFFRTNLPLMVLAQRNSWGAQQVLGSTHAYETAILDYINNTPITV